MLVKRGGNTECLTYFFIFLSGLSFHFQSKKIYKCKNYVCCVLWRRVGRGFSPKFVTGVPIFANFSHFWSFFIFSLCFFFCGWGTCTSTTCFSNAPTQTTNWKHFWLQTKRRYRIVTHLIPTQFLSCFFLGVCLFVCSNSEVEKNVGQLVPIFFSLTPRISAKFFFFHGGKRQKKIWASIANNRKNA